MPETTIKISETDSLLLTYSLLTSRTKVFHNSIEIASVPGLGGMTKFEVAGKKVEVENRITAFGTNKVTVRIDGNIVGEFNWL